MSDRNRESVSEGPEGIGESGEGYGSLTRNASRKAVNVLYESAAKARKKSTKGKKSEEGGKGESVLYSVWLAESEGDRYTIRLPFP